MTTPKVTGVELSWADIEVRLAPDGVLLDEQEIRSISTTPGEVEHYIEIVDASGVGTYAAVPRELEDEVRAALERILACPESPTGRNCTYELGRCTRCRRGRPSHPEIAVELVGPDGKPIVRSVRK